MITVCEICGNERQAGGRCPFCGTPGAEAEPARGRLFQHRTVNLEAGRPTVDLALHRLTKVVDDAIRRKITVLTIIHGYGSSGKGGVIREECRRTLDHLKNRGTIKEVIAGEDFHQKHQQVKSLLQRFPRLRSDFNLNRNNKGITLVVLSYGLMYCIFPVFTFHTTLPS